MERLQCIEMTKDLLYVKCTKCYNAYKKDGTPRKNAKLTVHTHWNETKDFSHRETHTAAHCLKSYKLFPNGYTIVINESTNISQ
jgi:hypothetical protein